MKRVLFLFAIFCVLNANSQTLLISFEGTGAVSKVSSVTVDNSTKLTTVTLSGDQILRLNMTTGINSDPGYLNSEMKIFPNPASDVADLQVLPPVAGMARISVIDISGKPVVQMQSYLEKSLQQFRLSGLKNGFYFVSVSGDGYSISEKLVSNASLQGKFRIDKIAFNEDSGKIVKLDMSKGEPSYVDMEFTLGDNLIFTGVSGIYTTLISSSPSIDKTIIFNFIACTDGDNTNYPVVVIGPRIWMAENLKTTRYSNNDLIGTTIPATLNTHVEISPKYQWAYNGDEGNVATYGRLYTGFAVQDTRNICPVGWHVPSDDEWENFISMMSGWIIGGGKLKETGFLHWWTPNSGATNEVGFKALPAGVRGQEGNFIDMGDLTYWYSSTANTMQALYSRFVYSQNSNIIRTSYDSWHGFSVRCIKD